MWSPTQIKHQYSGHHTLNKQPHHSWFSHAELVNSAYLISKHRLIAVHNICSIFLGQSFYTIGTTAVTLETKHCRHARIISLYQKTYQNPMLWSELNSSHPEDIITNTSTTADLTLWISKLSILDLRNRDTFSILSQCSIFLRQSYFIRKHDRNCAHMYIQIKTKLLGRSFF